jgi:hypothetical protein
MHCAKKGNKEGGIALNLFQKNITSCVLLAYSYLLILFGILFCNHSCSADLLNEAHELLMVGGPHFVNQCCKVCLTDMTFLKSAVFTPASDWLIL